MTGRASTAALALDPPGALRFSLRGRARIPDHRRDDAAGGCADQRRGARRRAGPAQRRARASATRRRSVLRNVAADRCGGAQPHAADAAAVPRCGGSGPRRGRRIGIGPGRRTGSGAARLTLVTSAAGSSSPASCSPIRPARLGSGVRCRSGRRRYRGGSPAGPGGAAVLADLASIAVLARRAPGGRCHGGRAAPLRRRSAELASAAGEVARLSAFLIRHQGGARFEVASPTVVRAAPLIVHDGRPVLMLTSLDGRPLLSPAKLAGLVSGGQVRFALLGRGACATSAGRACAPAVEWAMSHARDVSPSAGLPPGRSTSSGREPQRPPACDPSGRGSARQPQREARAGRSILEGEVTIQLASSSRPMASPIRTRPRSRRSPARSARRSVHGPRAPLRCRRRRRSRWPCAASISFDAGCATRMAHVPQRVVEQERVTIWGARRCGSPTAHNVASPSTSMLRPCFSRRTSSSATTERTTAGSSTSSLRSEIYRHRSG